MFSDQLMTDVEKYTRRGQFLQEWEVKTMRALDLFLKVILIACSAFPGYSVSVPYSKHWDSWIMIPAQASDNELGEASLIYNKSPGKSSPMPVYYSAKIDSSLHKNQSEPVPMSARRNSVSLVKDANSDRRIDTALANLSNLTKSSWYKVMLRIGKLLENYFFEEPSYEDGLEKSYTKTRAKVKRKYKKFMLPLLIAYKLKFFTLIPILLGGLTLLVGSTGLAGFFFALFVAVMGIKSNGHK